MREAERYGPDPWVFVRELIQNARDAGAYRVSLSVRGSEEGPVFACRDDGCGMSFDHARRYLFPLYASSKESLRGSAGRFGVGFWSILRFAPLRVLVRSWPEGSDPWEVTIDGSLTTLAHRPAPSGERGTEVVLVGRGEVETIREHVTRAAWESARFLTHRDRRSQSVTVSVEDQPINAPFTLPAPSASFRRGRLRGVVALSREPRFDIFAKGLHVRSASSLEELLSPSRSSRGPLAPRGGGGLAPGGLLEGDDLEVALARRDVRETKPLARLVDLASREMARLVERQLDLARPARWWDRGFGWRGQRMRTPLGIATSLGLALLFALGAAWGAKRLAKAPTWAAVAVAARAPRPHTDLATSYRGAQVDPGPTTDVVMIRYAPPDVPLYLGAGIVERPGEGLAPAAGVGSYEGPRCRGACVNLEVVIEARSGFVRLPVPTGHRVDPGTVRVDGSPVILRASAHGEALVPGPIRGAVTYGTQRSSERPPPEPASPVLPSALLAQAGRARRSATPARVLALTQTTRALVQYSRSPDVAARYARAAASGAPFAHRAVEVGAGDCDVQNGLLALLLQAAGVPARLVVGYVGVDGRALPGLHAWVEYYDAGSWHTADATPVGEPPGTVAGAAVAPDAGGDVRAPTLRPVRDPSPPRDARDLAPGVLRGLLGAATTVVFVLVLGALAWRTRRELRLDPRHDPTDLLRAALDRPEAFEGVPAVFSRRLIPTLGPRPVSLDEARDLGNQGRLFASSGGSPLARRAARAGAVVLDPSSPEGRLAADALGAVDLDAWDSTLARGRRTPLSRRLEASLRGLGEEWNLLIASGPAPGPILDLPQEALGVPFGPGPTCLIDPRETWWAEASQLFEDRPDRATLAAAERLASLLGVPGDLRGLWLVDLARKAVVEAGR